jgi:methylmalonyl-CoA/ethylmalonyl-CoA epimerase
MCRHPGAMPVVEIIYAGAGKSPVDNLVNLRPDGLVYHLCFVTADVVAWLQRMEQSGMRAVCVVPPAPAVCFGGRPASFYNVVGVGLCEIIEDQGRTLA